MSFFKRFAESKPHAKATLAATYHPEQPAASSQQSLMKASAHNRREFTLEPDPPVVGNWDSAHTTIGAGVAIFHLAANNVVLCFHSQEGYWFLPKGRRDANEDTASGAEREGFEEVRFFLSIRTSANALQSGYRNRLLPLPIPNRQPKAHHPSPGAQGSRFVTEPVWTQLVPVTKTAQYICFWYIAETIPPALEMSLSLLEKEQNMAYHCPSKFEPGMTLAQRIEMEGLGYEPIKHEHTGVDAEELLYESYLVPIDEAIRKLGTTTLSADVVRKGWDAICLRRHMEEENHESIRSQR